MVGIVLVSHSPALAAGLVELLAQLAPDVAVAVAAGTDDGRLGTSPDAVAAALASADRGEGAVVLPDLGSAVLSVRVALEDDAVAGDPARTARLILVDAPFVEGAVAAAVTAGSGADLAEVVAAARGARDVAKF